MAIAFTCPNCNSSMNVDDRYAGTTGPCKNCGQQITIPGTSQPSFQPAPQSNTVSITIAILGGLVIFGLLVIGILVALLLPAVQSAREAARRVSCSNNQKQIVLALLNYESANGHFPPAYTTDADGKPMHSWRVLILPYLEEQLLYDAYDFDKPWDSPENLELTSNSTPAAFMCPSDPAGMSGETSYFAVVDPNGIFRGVEETNMRDVRDGLSNTAIVVESSGEGVHWAEPVDLAVDDLGNLKSTHPSGANTAFADGSVRCVPTVTPSMVIMNDGQ